MRTHNKTSMALLMSAIVISSIGTVGLGDASSFTSSGPDSKPSNMIQDWQIDVNNISYGETVHGIVDTGDKKYKDKTAKAQPDQFEIYHFELISFTGTAGTKISLNASLPDTESRRALITVFSCAKQAKQTKRRCDQHVSKVVTVKSGQPANLTFRLPTNGTYQIQIGGVPGHVPPQLKYTLSLNSPAANETLSKVERLQQRLEEKNKTIASLQTQVKNQSQTIQEQQSKINTLEERLKEQKQTVEFLRTRLEQQNQTIEALRQRLNESNVSALYEQIEQQNQTIQRLRQQLQEKKQMIQEILHILQNETAENATQNQVYPHRSL